MTLLNPYDLEYRRRLSRFYPNLRANLELVPTLMMNMQSAVPELEKQWQEPHGFFWQLRMGIFDLDQLAMLLQILESVDVEDREPLDRRFVELTWYTLLFMSWQEHRVQEQGGDMKEFNAAFHEILSLLEKILGLP